MRTVQTGDVPEQSPVQESKLYPGPGVAVRVTTALKRNCHRQLGPGTLQLIPGGQLVTFPNPLWFHPLTVSPIVKLAKKASTVLSRSITTPHVAFVHEDEHSLDHP